MSAAATAVAEMEGGNAVETGEAATAKSVVANASAIQKQKKWWSPLRLRLARLRDRIRGRGGGLKKNAKSKAAASSGDDSTTMSVTVALGGDVDAASTTDVDAIAAAAAVAEFDEDEDEDEDDFAEDEDDEEGAAGESKRFRKTQVYPLGARRGKVVLVNRCVTTSGRRIEEMGNLKATMVHFLIGLSWYAGATPDDMVELYKRFYADVR